MSDNSSKTKSNQFIIIVMLIIICLLGAGVSYLFYKNSQKSQEIVNLEVGLSQASIKEDSLTIALDQEIEKLTLLKGKYEDLDEQSEKLNQLILELKKGKLEWQNRANLNKQQISVLEAQLRKNVEDFESKRSDMMNEIEQLKKLTKILDDKNKNLNFSNDSLKAASQDQVAVNKVILKKASRLKAENLRMEIKGKNNKILSRAPYKESNILSVNAVFNISKNELAEKGNRTAVLRIKKPDGGILYDISANANTFVTSNNQEFYYTVSKKINFTNEFDEVYLTFNKQSEMLEGIYNVEIYLDGDEIGLTSFEVK